MAPPSIFSLAPTTPVNKGLATEVKPLYPEQIALLQKAGQQKIQKAGQQRAIKAQNLEWLEKKAIDPEGMSDYEISTLNDTMKDISDRFSSDVGAGKDPMITNTGYRKELAEVTSLAQRYRVSGEVESNIALGLKKGGAYADRMDKGKTYAAMADERNRAEAAGEVPDFSEIVDDPENLSLSLTGKTFNDNLELQYDQELRQMVSDDSEEEFQALTKYINANIWQRNDDGSYVYKNDQRVVKPRATPEFLEQVRADTDYYSALKVEAKRQDIPVAELAYQQFLQRNDISEIDKLVHTTGTKSTTEGSESVQATVTLVSQGFAALQPGDPAGTEKTWLASMGGKGLSFKKDGSKITGTISKVFLDQLSQANMILMAQKLDIDISAVGDDADALRDLMSKEVRVGNNTFTIDLRADYNAGLMEIMRTSGLGKSSQERAAINQYLQGIQGQTGQFYKDEKQYTFPGSQKDLSGQPLKTPQTGISLGLGKRNGN